MADQVPEYRHCPFCDELVLIEPYALIFHMWSLHPAELETYEYRAWR